MAGRQPEMLEQVGPVGDQAAIIDVESSVVDRREFVPGRERDD